MQYLGVMVSRLRLGGCGTLSSLLHFVEAATAPSPRVVRHSALDAE